MDNELKFEHVPKEPPIYENILGYPLYNKIGEGVFSSVFATKEGKKNLAAKIQNIWEMDKNSSSHSIPVKIDYNGGNNFSIKTLNGYELRQDIDDMNITNSMKFYVSEREALRRLKGAQGIINYEKSSFFIREGKLCSILLMEYPKRARTLNYFTEKGMDLSEKYRIMHHLGKAIDSLKNQNIVHRDIKPKNVLILPDKKVKLIDFGLSYFKKYTPYPNEPMDRQMFLETKINQPKEELTVGSPGYLSPEQCYGPNVNHSSDIFSGILTMLTMFNYGKSPLDADDSLDNKTWNEQTKINSAYYDDIKRKSILEELAKKVHPKIKKAIGEGLWREESKRTLEPLIEATEIYA